MDKDNINKESDKIKPYNGNIMFHPIFITTLIVKDGLIVGYTQK